MKKRTFTISFKQEVISYMELGNSCYKAKNFFGDRDGCSYSQSMFQQWYKNKEAIRAQSASMKRASGGGRKPLLGTLEELIFDEIIELRIMKVKVTRTFISDRAITLGEQNGIDIKASGRWIDGFMKRNGFSLRRTINFTNLSDDTLISRAINYMRFLRATIPTIDLSKTLLMDETAVYFEDNRTHTVDLKGRRHVIMKSTGFSSMRITVISSVWANGRKAMPLAIHKGKNSFTNINLLNNIYSVTQEKAWVNQDLIIAWINLMFPLFDASQGKCIVWDSCRAHISERVKEHCRKRNIKLVVIPGGLTPYLQAGDIGIFKEFKDRISSFINIWKNSEEIEYTRRGNPKAPSQALVNLWISNAWSSMSIQNIKNSIQSAGFSENFEDWHISKHDIYGDRFRNEFINSSFEDSTTTRSDNDFESDVFDLADE